MFLGVNTTQPLCAIREFWAEMLDEESIACNHSFRDTWCHIRWLCSWEGWSVAHLLTARVRRGQCNFRSTGAHGQKSLLGEPPKRKANSPHNATDDARYRKGKISFRCQGLVRMATAISPVRCPAQLKFLKISRNYYPVRCNHAFAEVLRVRKIIHLMGPCQTAQMIPSSQGMQCISPSVA